MGEAICSALGLCDCTPDDKGNSGVIIIPNTHNQSSSFEGERQPGLNVPLPSDSYDSRHNQQDGGINRLTLCVIQARNLPIYNCEPNAMLNPYVQVTFNGLNHAEYGTETVSGSNPVWNAHFREESQWLFGKVSSIQLDVFDHNSVTADAFIGYCVIETDPSPNYYYSTAIHWVDLLDDRGERLNAAIQVQLKYALNADDIDTKGIYYTHVMELIVKKGKNIPHQAFAHRSDPYVKVEWGAQTHSTKPIKYSLHPEWNETAYLFVRSESDSVYGLKLCVMDRDVGVDDQLGTGYIPSNQIFQHCGLDGNRRYRLDVSLREVPVSLDRGLMDFTKDNSFRKWGDLEVEIRLIPKAMMESNFHLAMQVLSNYPDIL
eukprot:186492_1